jgi:hypothetical protein
MSRRRASSRLTPCGVGPVQLRASPGTPVTGALVRKRLLLIALLLWPVGRSVSREA